MSWSPSRASRAGRIRFRAGAGVLALRGGASLLLVIGLLLVSGACGQDVQTNRPYTPAEGVNFDVGDPAVAQQGGTCPQPAHHQLCTWRRRRVRLNRDR